MSLKYLQVKQNDKLLDQPKLLVEGVDFDMIWENALWKLNNNIRPFWSFINPLKKEVLNVFATDIDYDFGDLIANISDCYKQKPLLEIDGFCEFRLMMSNCGSKENPIVTHDSLGFFVFDGYCLHLIGGSYSYELQHKNKRYDWGSYIFTPENKIEYPELYEQAINKLNQN